MASCAQWDVHITIRLTVCETPLLRQWTRRSITSCTDEAGLYRFLDVTSSDIISIGMALTDSLDELVTEGHVTPQLAIRALEQVGGEIRINVRF